MANQTTKSVSKTDTTYTNTAGMGLPVAVGKIALQAWLDIGSDAVRFVSVRLQQDIDTQNAMLACTSLEQMSKVQADFFKAAQNQYAAQAQHMMEMAGTAGRALAPASNKLGYDDVPV